MSISDKNYKDFQELLYEDFYELFWDAVSENVVSTQYLDLNDSFTDNLAYDFYWIFKNDGSLTIRVLARLAEVFFHNYFKYQPGHKNIPEIKD